MAEFADLDPETAAPLLRVPGDWRRADVPGDYTVLWDRDRAYGQVWPRPAPVDVAAFYRVDDYYTHDGPAQTARRAGGLGQRIMTKLSWLADHGVEADADWWARCLGPRPLRILEIGCGSGETLSRLAALGHEVTGVEPDPAARALAGQGGHAVHDGTAEALPDALRGARFDAVLFLHVLEHCIDPFAAMRNAAGLLAPGGLIVAEVPNNACLGLRRFGPFWHWLDVPRHLNFFTRKSLCTLFEAAGLSVGEVAFCGYCRQFSSGWKATQDTIAARFGMGGDARVAPRSYWAYLARTARAADAHKYDSVRVTGRIPGRSG